MAGDAGQDVPVGKDGTDLVSVLANKLPEDGVPLSEQDFNMYFTLLVIAGNETTRHAISNAMLGLMEQRDQMTRMQADPSLIPNRDEAMFADAYSIKLDRGVVDHMTFGKGSPHLCLGNNLARMEIRLMFEELLPRLQDIQLAGDVQRVRSNFVNGIKAFPVSVVPG